MIGVCARAGGANAHKDLQTCLKILPPKFLDQNFLNLLHAREARGNPTPPYAALRAARFSDDKIPLALKLVSLLNTARTYFSNHAD